MNVSKVAEVEGVTERAVYDWKRKYEEEGMDGLDAKPSGGGRHPELPDEKLPEPEELLLEGAEAHGFEGDLWTLPRVTRLLEEELVMIREEYCIWCSIPLRSVVSNSPGESSIVRRLFREELRLIVP